jgi:hypothetical protein
VYFQYPLESLARRRSTRSQMDFARQAKLALVDTDELFSRPFAEGLVLFAANEDALEEPARILRDLYGEVVELQPPRVRVIPGAPEQEPIMNVRITARLEHEGAIVAELRRRGAEILEKCVRGRIFIVRAEAPLAILLGLPAALDALSGRTAAHAIRLVRYAPVPPPFDPQVA